MVSLENKIFACCQLSCSNSIYSRRAKLNNLPWINSALKNGMCCRNATKKKAITTKNPYEWANYKKLRNKINNKVKTTKASIVIIALFNPKDLENY